MLVLAPVRDQEPGAQVPAYLTAEQVRQMLQVSDKSVYRWLKDDPTMPALKIGGTWDKPKVSGVDVGKLVIALVAAAGKDVLSGAVEDFFGGGDDKKDDNKKDKKKGKKKQDKKSAGDKAMDAAKGLLGN